MAYFKKTNLFKQIFFSRGTILVIFFLIIFTGFGLYSIIGKSINASNERKNAESEVADLNSKEADLSKQIDLLKTPEGQDDVLKEQYPVVSPGEHVVVITDNPDEATSVSEQTQASGSKGFWDYLKKLF